jgi:uncharacterized protein YndB with AHSA1/START domain
MAQRSDLAGPQSAANELTMTRIFDAPRYLVFKAWTAPEHIMHWFCPNGFTLPVCEMDFRVGGRFRLCMRASNGNEHWVNGAYREIIPVERIVWSGTMEHDGNEILTTVTFDDQEKKTKLTVHQTYSVETDSTRGARQGWTETLERLAVFLARN